MQSENQCTELYIGRPCPSLSSTASTLKLRMQCSKLRFHIVQTLGACVAKIVHPAICPRVLPYIKVSIF